MFFFLFPSTTVGRSKRALVAFVILAILAYRFVLSQKFSQLQIQLLPYFPPGRWDAELFSAILQSAFTPVLPPRAFLEHTLLLYLSVPCWLGFWWMFGGGLEEYLGRMGLITFYAVGILLGVGLVATPGIAMQGSFWLGHAAMLFCIGAAYLLFLDVDVKIHYTVWLAWEGLFSGTWKVPSLFLIVPIHVITLGSQSMFWYSTPDPPIETKDGLMTPLVWHLVLPILGLVAALLWRKFLVKGEKKTKSAPVRAI